MQTLGRFSAKRGKLEVGGEKPRLCVTGESNYSGNYRNKLLTQQINKELKHSQERVLFLENGLSEEQVANLSRTELLFNFAMLCRIEIKPDAKTRVVLMH